MPGHQWGRTTDSYQTMPWDEFLRWLEGREKELGIERSEEDYDPYLRERNWVADAARSTNKYESPVGYWERRQHLPEKGSQAVEGRRKVASAGTTAGRKPGVGTTRRRPVREG